MIDWLIGVAYVVGYLVCGRKFSMWLLDSSVRDMLSISEWCGEPSAERVAEVVAEERVPSIAFGFIAATIWPVAVPAAVVYRWASRSGWMTPPVLREAREREELKRLREFARCEGLPGFEEK